LILFYISFTSSVTGAGRGEGTDHPGWHHPGDWLPN